MYITMLYIRCNNTHRHTRREQNVQDDRTGPTFFFFVNSKSRTLRIDRVIPSSCTPRYTGIRDWWTIIFLHEAHWNTTVERCTVLRKKRRGHLTAGWKALFEQLQIIKSSSKASQRPLRSISVKQLTSVSPCLLTNSSVLHPNHPDPDPWFYRPDLF